MTCAYGTSYGSPYGEPCTPPSVSIPAARVDTSQTQTAATTIPHPGSGGLPLTGADLIPAVLLAAFLVGLGLIAVGAVRDRRKRRADGT